MAEEQPQEIHEVEIPDFSPAREMNPIEFFTPGGNPVGGRDFRPSTFVFDNEEETLQETEDGHGNMNHTVARKPLHPSKNRRNLRRTDQQEIEFPEDLIPDPSGVPQTEEEGLHPADSEEPKHAPGITGSKRNQPEQE